MTFGSLRDALVFARHRRNKRRYRARVLFSRARRRPVAARVGPPGRHARTQRKLPQDAKGAASYFCAVGRRVFVPLSCAFVSIASTELAQGSAGERPSRRGPVRREGRTDARRD